MKNKFLEKVAEQIEDERSRELITAELESHLLDKIDYYVDIGYSKEESEKRATEEMGNPDDTAVPLNSLHNNNFRDLLSFICCGVIVLMFFCTIWLRYAFIYSYDNQSYRHSIICDFVSLAFLITYVVMLILARKKNTKIIPIFVAISFILQFFSVIIYDYNEAALTSTAPPNMFYFYQPAMYAIVKTVTEGFVAYSKCIFIEVPAKTNSFCFNALPYILGLIFIVWAILLFIKILKAEKVDNRKKYSIPIRLIEICASIFLSVNLIITVTATAYRTVNNFATGNGYSASREQMSEYVLNADLTQNKSEIISDLTLEGYYENTEIPAEFYGKSGTISVETGMDNDGRYTSLAYYLDDDFITYDESVGAFINKRDIYDKTPEILSVIDAIKKIDKGDDFESIKESGILKLANGICKTYYRDKKKTVYEINFTIYFKGYDDTSDDGSNFFFKSLTIEDGKVTDYCD